LLAKSLVMMRERGLKEASLDVETQNTSGELQLYESMGYRVARKYAHYTKPLD
jgi:ribosomal protein S18 acetylase RimI-like enzyme